MKKEARNYLEGYANIIIYIVIIIGTLLVANLLWAWPTNTPQVIIFIMCLLVIFDVFKQALMDPFKGKKIKKILLILIVALIVIGIIVFYIKGWAIF
nr:hypothetical protein [uncultured Methanobacterium sp.]